MLRKILIIFLFVIPLIYADWKLVWSDEFEGNSLDTSKWDVEVNCWGGGNLEKQCYVNRQQNIYVQGGSLHIRPIAGNYQGRLEGCTLNNENSCTWTQPSTSGRIRTLNSRDGHWRYGKFEIRARMPKGDFLWPAIWMLPTDNEYGIWAGSGEIDIMEFRGQDRNSVSHAIHFGSQWPNNRYYGSGDLKYNTDFTEDYHVYGLEWTEDNLIFFIDGRETHRESLRRSFGSMYSANGQPFDKRFHLIMNVAVGGNFFDPAKYGPFDISRASTWTQPLSVDYVRIYTWEEGGSQPTEPPVTEPPVTEPPVTEPPVTEPPTGNLGAIPLIPSSDGYFDSVNSKKSYSKDSVLLLKKHGDHQRCAYLKFYVPTGDISSANLLLYGGIDSPSPSSASVKVYAISNEWQEEGLTFENKIERGKEIATGEIKRGHEWASFDITEYVKEQIDSGKNIISVELDLVNEGNAIFNSAKSGENQPLLRLC